MISVCTERCGSLPLLATVQNGPQQLPGGVYNHKQDTSKLEECQCADEFAKQVLPRPSRATSRRFQRCRKPRSEGMQGCDGEGWMKGDNL